MLEIPEVLKLGIISILQIQKAIIQYNTFKSINSGSSDFKLTTAQSTIQQTFQKYV